MGQCLGEVDKGVTAPVRGPNSVGPNFGPNNFVRPRLEDGHYSFRPNANYVHFSPHVSSTAPEVPWRTKLRARVFDVDSSQYDSSLFVGIPPEFLLGARRGVQILGLLTMCVKMLLIFIPPICIQVTRLLLWVMELLLRFLLLGILLYLHKRKCFFCRMFYVFQPSGRICYLSLSLRLKTIFSLSFIRLIV
ncbi:hypothetical protein ES319_A05G347900v1 [Gossypium barbadense]|uniref:Uncharacterized protein n=2 Tax=Gossypium TaxID=3633 RepID=A0A5J5VYF6_GOSBA|nr:hypothetical protein ES319_A05G347900v1 [Gossypium barbadense]KAB2084646.1 hypothetical protein ES319_A05G347900v1 [Gossypium barbadense]